MISHEEARAAVRDAFELLGEPYTRAALQLAQAVALGESAYGAGWEGVDPPPHNWGAIQYPCASRCPGLDDLGEGCCWPCPPGSFEYLDSRPDPPEKYRACFKRYDSDAEGAADVVRNILSRPGAREAMLRGDTRGTSAAMYHGGYYQGRGATAAERIDNHAQGLEYNRGRIARALSEPIDRPPPPAVAAGALLLGAAALGAVIWSQA